MIYRPYLIEYWHEGSLWSLTIHATSEADALARCKQLWYARVLGTVEAEIPASLGWFARLWCWLRAHGEKPERRAE